MSLLKVQKKEVASPPFLLRLVLRFIYEKDKMKLEEIHLMQSSVIGWSQKVKLDSEMLRHNELESEFVQRIGWMLKKEQEGYFNERKRLFKEKQIDWRKFHRLPEAYNPEDLAKAQEQYKKYAEANPEQEDMGSQSVGDVNKILGKKYEDPDNENL